jgi:hypothetical protein
MGVILVISHAQDEHALAVLGELKRLGADARLLDLSLFPQQLRLVMKYEQSTDPSIALRPSRLLKNARLSDEASS